MPLVDTFLYGTERGDGGQYNWWLVARVEVNTVIRIHHIALIRYGQTNYSHEPLA